MAQETQSERSEDAADGLEADAQAGGLAPGLHLLSTPIGAAGDVTLRGLAALRDADALACEDTRVLRKLMDIHGVALRGRPLIAYHEHNAEMARPKILSLLAEGKSVVFASDAGTPLIADPGYKLVREARAQGAAVTPLPGPSAALAALVASGQPTDAFAFLGFPPSKPGPRRRLFERWSSAPASLILYESPRRLSATLRELAAVMGAERPATVARELTKRFEEFRTGELGPLAERFEAAPPKGEVVVVIGPPKRAEDDVAAIDALLERRLEVESLKDAVRTVVEHLGAGKKMVYERALLKRDESRGLADGRDGGDGGDA